MSSSFHLQTDGLSERTNKTLNQALRAAVDRSHAGWVAALLRIRFHIMNLFSPRHAPGALSNASLLSQNKAGSRVKRYSLNHKPSNIDITSLTAKLLPHGMMISLTRPQNSSRAAVFFPSRTVTVNPLPHSLPPPKEEVLGWALIIKLPPRNLSHCTLDSPGPSRTTLP
jgi:hypothetical protein